MEDKYFKLEIITPFQIIYQQEVKHARMPGTEGYFGILAGHAPFITTLRVGEIKVDLEHETKYFATSGGTVEVLPHSVTVLVETAEEASQIDVARALAAKDRAEKRLKEKTPDTDLERAKAALLRAINRIGVAQRYSSS